ncbi:substrate-binding periplasmic protein [Pseudomonas sp.]|uniref:substrate-binding periplasmic protein n=1 Tax=Pseudomonas sp. TaxID=306 RepID=UPI003C78BDE0
MKFLLLLSLLYLPLCHAEQLLHADYRERPPEMQVVDSLPAGPLIEVLDTAAQRVGARIEWRYAPFVRSLEDLKSGRIDLVPRVLFTAERLDYVHFLPSIGTQRKSIRFIVKAEQQASLRSYADLHGKVIGAKRGTAYFDQFDSDRALKKSLATDDYLLAGMFRAGRLDVMVVLDAEAIEAQFRKIGFSDYSYAEYQHEQSVGNYYGASKRHYLGEKKALYEQLEQALRGMRESGEIARIYHRYGVAPPETEE